MGLMDTHKPQRDDDQRELHRQWVDTVKDQGVNLTTREEEFIESIDERLAAGRSLSEAQAEWLESIYAKKTP